MATAIIDGIETSYEVIGSGPPLLMCAPGGFDADVRKWRTQGIYSTLDFLGHLPAHYSCIVYDRRDTGVSGGRVEAVTWRHHADHAMAMLQHLGYETAHVMGGCMGCTVATAFAVAYPDACRSMVLFWPVGGAKYRISAHQRFAEHLAFVHQNGLQAVVDLAREDGKSFGKDARVGPWVSVLRRDDAFAEAYAAQDRGAYKLIVTQMARTLIDRDSAPGAEAEELLRLATPTLIVPGNDESHARSAAVYLSECLPEAEYWDVPVASQTKEATNDRVLAFLAGIDGKP